MPISAVSFDLVDEAAHKSSGNGSVAAGIFEGGEVGAAYLAAVFVSNLPEAISATSGLSRGGWPSRRILGMWTTLAPPGHPVGMRQVRCSEH